MANQVVGVWQHTPPFVINWHIIDIHCDILSSIVAQCMLHGSLLHRYSILIALLDRSLLENTDVVDDRRVFLVIWVDSGLIKCGYHIAH